MSRTHLIEIAWGAGTGLVHVCACVLGLVPAYLTARASPCVLQPQERVCECPPGEEWVLSPVEQDSLHRLQGAVAEEACWKTASGKRVRHGPSVLWGPNGERLAEGSYVMGLKTGVWRHWMPSQETERYWTDGRLDSSRVISTPESITLDFCACRPQRGLRYWTLGSQDWQVVDAGADSCRILLRLEMEGGYGPYRQYIVPRTLGRQTFGARPHRTIDFSSIEPFFEAKVGQPYNIFESHRWPSE